MGFFGFVLVFCCCFLLLLLLLFLVGWLVVFCRFVFWCFVGGGGGGGGIVFVCLGLGILFVCFVLVWFSLGGFCLVVCLFVFFDWWYYGFINHRQKL